MRSSIAKSLLLPLGLLLPGQVLAASCTDLSDLTILAGQHIIYSYSEASVPQELLDLASQGLVGGVILFGANVGDTTGSDMDALQQAYAEGPGPAVVEQYTGLSGPLLITTDQEGGEVRRIPLGPTLSAKEMGAASDPASAGTTGGQQAAEALLDYNANTNLAPVLGVFRAAGDFLDEYQRSFGDTSQQVIAAAIPFLQAQQVGGTIATAKHFPGLGAATADQDTDAEPVTLNVSLTDLQNIDMKPFEAAVAAGVDMVMPSWAIYPALDTMPSGLSTKWVQGQLRGTLGFTGVTITDSMEAGAILPYGDDAARVKLATEAGMDLLLAAIQDPTQGQNFTQALASAVCSGELDRDAFDASTTRIMTLRSKYA